MTKSKVCRVLKRHFILVIISLSTLPAYAQINNSVLWRLENAERFRLIKRRYLTGEQIITHYYKVA